ncbi:hypothetical protein QQS21_009866 [Conoideocrella luteorostrata]|uniref:Uncharacterized protein n=1 Tax=Conoideocrella luteorostrata TaxID=1105319 RepID=A0AAJ0CGC3_9HYPO|nr:hypothetical protein QQS21_009866 [Conoideocrella luteorostrata]
MNNKKGRGKSKKVSFADEEPSIRDGNPTSHWINQLLAWLEYTGDCRVSKLRNEMSEAGNNADKQEALMLRWLNEESPAIQHVDPAMDVSYQAYHQYSRAFGKPGEILLISNFLNRFLAEK